MSSETTKTYFSSLVGVLNESEWSDSKFDSNWKGEGKSSPLPSLPPLVVPAFQRLYEWSEEMVTNFTTILFDKFNRKVTPDGEKNVVFASTVFLHLHQHEPNVSPYKDSRYRAYILDGQQRLVTLSLIILVLMDRLSKEKPTDPGEDDHNDMVEKLHDRLFFKLNSIKVPRIALHPTSQHDIWKCFLLSTKDGRKNFNVESIFWKNYTAIDKALDDCIPECLDKNTRKKEKEKLNEFSKSLLDDGLCKGVLLVRCESLPSSLLMLTGINTPGRPLDAVSYVKFHLAKSRADEGQKDVAKLDSSTPNSAVFVAACAILENVKTAVMTDELSIVTEALAVSKNRIDSIRIFEDFDNGLNYEETYWT